MLGENWEEIHGNWLHRLGNLTLTAYNSEYRNRPFHEKKEVDGGFDKSAVRLNEYARNQSQWTDAQMEIRGRELGERALKIWPFHDADEKKIQEADIRELRECAAMSGCDESRYEQARSEITRSNSGVRSCIRRRDRGDRVEVGVLLRSIVFC